MGSVYILFEFNHMMMILGNFQFAQLHFKQLLYSRPIKVNDGGHSIALVLLFQVKKEFDDDDAMQQQHRREHQLVTMGSGEKFLSS